MADVIATPKALSRSYGHCAIACLSTQLTIALSHCQRCIRNTLDDDRAYMCIGKLAYLRHEHETACQSYVRATAISLVKRLDSAERLQLRRLNEVSCTKATDYAISMVVEHEPTLIYHLGHAWQAYTGSKEMNSYHLAQYVKGLRHLAPEAYSPPPNLLLTYHDKGVAALRHHSSLLLAVIEKYCRFAENTI